MLELCMVICGSVSLTTQFLHGSLSLVVQIPISHVHVNQRTIRTSWQRFKDCYIMCPVMFCLHVCMCVHAGSTPSRKGTLLKSASQKLTTSAKSLGAGMGEAFSSAGDSASKLVKAAGIVLPKFFDTPVAVR